LDTKIASYVPCKYSCTAGAVNTNLYIRYKYNNFFIAVEGCVSKPHPFISVGHASPLRDANESEERYVNILT